MSGVLGGLPILSFECREQDALQKWTWLPILRCFPVCFILEISLFHALKTRSEHEETTLRLTRNFFYTLLKFLFTPLLLNNITHFRSLKDKIRLPIPMKSMPSWFSNRASNIEGPILYLSTGDPCSCGEEVQEGDGDFAQLEQVFTEIKSLIPLILLLNIY